MKKEEDQKLALTIIMHLIFWAIIGWVFLNISFLRPACKGIYKYKELISVLIICLLVYCNYFILIPKLFLKRKFYLFWIIVICAVFLSGLLETLLVKSNMQSCFANSMAPEYFSRYCRIVCLLVCIRNAGFFGVVFIERNYKRLKDSLLNTKRIFSSETNSLIVSTPNGAETTVQMGDITYISCSRNVSTIYLFNSLTSYSQYVSLVYFENLIPDNQRLRINKNTIIMYKYVVDYTKDKVTVIINLNQEESTFMLSSSNAQTLYELLKLHPIIRKKRTSKNCENSNKNLHYKKDETDNNLHYKKDEMAKRKRLSLMILRVISENPGLNRLLIAKKFDAISERSVATYLKELKDSGRIEYRGSKRTGGYFAVTKEEVTTS